MQISRKIKKKIGAIKHKLRIVQNNNSAKINQVAYHSLIRDIEEIDNTLPLGTSTWEKYRKNLRKAILSNKIDDFLNWEVIQNSMFFNAPEIEYVKVKEHDKLFQSIKECKVGNPYPYYLNKETSGNVVHHAFSALQILKKVPLEKINRIVEFGGGYGSMCRIFKNIGFKKKYLIFDLPEFLALQKYYLSSIEKAYIDNTVFTGDYKLLKDTNQSGTLFMATWSISEAPLEVREDFLKVIGFDYCVIAFQSNFDNIDNVRFFKEFGKKYPGINFEINSINHLDGNYYMIGYKKI